MTYRYRFGERPLDGYTIRRGVGHGAFGEVYYAVSDGGREVALKSILRGEEIELRGVRQCINLKSPQLVSVFDVRAGQDGTTFVIMEYMTGPSLRDIIREHPRGLGAPETTHLLREIGKGLTCLHDHGIVHRDLKPENIFYEDGRAKIGDYGLAKLLGASHQSGQTMSVGTVHYMAPEIGSGNYHRGIDIYSLGIILHELRTGRVPFEGESFGEILMKHLTAAPDLSSLDEPFRSAVAGALVKDPRERFQTVDDMLRPLIGEESLDEELSTLHPGSLSTMARNCRAEAQPAAVAASPEAPSVLAVAESGSVEMARSETAPPDHTAQLETEAPQRPIGEPDSDVERSGPLGPEGPRGPVRTVIHGALLFVAWFAAQLWALVKKLGVSVWHVVRDTGRGLRFLLVAPFRRRVRSREPGDAQPPAKRGVLVRIFWASVGSAIFAGGVCCILAPFFLIGEFHYPDQILICVGIGVALAVFGRRVLVILTR